MFLTFWPLRGREVKRKKLLFWVTGRQPGNIPQWELRGLPGKTGVCGLPGVSLIVKKVDNAARLQSLPMDHCGWLFSGLCRSPCFNKNMAKIKLVA